jgi:hypothetical protein
MRILVIANSDVRDVPLAMAADDLRSQGYHVEITPMMSGALMADALSRGDAELASFNNETLWAAIAKGLRAKTIVQRLSFPNLVIANRGELYTRALEQLKTDPEETTSVIDALIAAGAWDPNGALTRDKVQYTLSFLQDTGAVPKELRVDDVADLAPLNDVLNDIGRQ